MLPTSRRHGHGELERLARIAHVEAGGEALALGGEASRGKLGGSPSRISSSQHRPHLADRRLAGSGDAGAHEVAPHIGDQQPERREVAGQRRHHDRAHAELIGDLGRVQRAGAAEGKSAKSRGSMPRITETSLMAPASETAARRKIPSAILHRAPGQARPAKSAITRLAAAASRSISPPSAARRRGRPSTTLASVTVGSLAAAAIAGGTRHCPRRARTDGQKAARAERRNAAAADADRIDVDLPDLDGKGADPAFRRHGVVATAHQAHVGRRAAHVAGDEVGITARGADVSGRDHAGGGPGQHRQHGHRLDAMGGQRAAVRRHDRQRRRAYRPATNVVREVAQISAHARGDIGIERRGGEALVLPELGQAPRPRSSPLRSVALGDQRGGTRCSCAGLA